MKYLRYIYDFEIDAMDKWIIGITIKAYTYLIKTRKNNRAYKRTRRIYKAFDVLI